MAARRLEADRRGAGERRAGAPRRIPAQDVYLVPAFVGLGAPYWDAEARGALFGLTRATGPDELARAALEAVCYQTRDLLEAMQRRLAGGGAKAVLRVDGGMVASDWTMQCLADILDAPVDRPTIRRRRRWAPPGSPVTRLGFGPTRRALPGCGSSSAPSRPGWRRPNGSANMRAGSARSLPCSRRQRMCEEDHDGDLQP